MEEVIPCFSRYMNSVLPQHPTRVCRCASLWPTVAPPKIIHGGGCLEQQQQEQLATVTHFRSFLFLRKSYNL